MVNNEGLTYMIDEWAYYDLITFKPKRPREKFNITTKINIVLIL